MSQTVHPYAFRLVTLRDWKSRWFAYNPKTFVTRLKTDTLLRAYLNILLKASYIADIQFERTEKTLRIILETSRPGMLIGKGGEGITKIRSKVTKFIAKRKLDVPSEVKIDILEIENPDSSAMIIAKTIDDGLRRRVPFRRLIKQGLEKAMLVKGVKGCRILVSGTLGGSASMARVEQVRKGPIPLQFIRADIDYASHAVKGLGIGVKVWINKGDSLENKKNESLAPKMQAPRGQGGARRPFNQNR
jgi:small subunit ribosomal protein S3